MPIDRTNPVVSRPELTWIPRTLLEAATLTPVVAGETVFRRGDRPTAMMCVVQGEIRLVRRSLDGTEIVLQRSRGGFIAEASMGSKAYHCDGVTAVAGQLLRIPMRAFRDALDHDPDFRNAWIAHLAREVRSLRAQCERLGLHGAAQRILHYIESEGCKGVLALSQSRKAWAAELGLSHEALYRTLRSLQAEGVVSVTGTTISLRHP
jgi:CRP-like cAMP-binding protein